MRSRRPPSLVCCQFGVSSFPIALPPTEGPGACSSRAGTFCSSMGPHRRNVRRRRDARARGIFPGRSAALLARNANGYHDTALIRSDLAKAGFSTHDRNQNGESRAPSHRYLAISLWPGHTATKQIADRGGTLKQQPKPPQPPSRASMAAARSPPKSRRMSFWRGHRTRPAARRRHDGRSIFASPVVGSLASLRHPLGLRDFARSHGLGDVAQAGLRLGIAKLGGEAEPLKARPGFGPTLSPLRDITHLICDVGLPASASGRKADRGHIVAAV